MGGDVFLKKIVIVAHGTVAHPFASLVCIFLYSGQLGVYGWGLEGKLLECMVQARGGKRSALALGMRSERKREKDEDLQAAARSLEGVRER